jgi:hypothetical protein
MEVEEVYNSIKVLQYRNDFYQTFYYEINDGYLKKSKSEEFDLSAIKTSVSVHENLEEMREVLSVDLEISRSRDEGLRSFSTLIGHVQGCIPVCNPPLESDR